MNIFNEYFQWLFLWILSLIFSLIISMDILMNISMLIIFLSSAPTHCNNLTEMLVVFPETFAGAQHPHSRRDTNCFISSHERQ